MPEINSTFPDLIRHVVNGRVDAVSDQLAIDPALATATEQVGATRENAKDFFFAEIRHYLYAGDTALHMAAAAFQSTIAKLLVEHGAELNAKNRRGQQRKRQRWPRQISYRRSHKCPG
jgi:Ankyrin repeat